MQLKMPRKPKLIFAAGGTGGHLFPAQTLAKELQLKNPYLSIVFAAYGLSHNRFFEHERFVFRDIASATPFRRNPVRALRSLFSLSKGIFQALILMRREKPDLVIGFGSYHSFPILLAAKLMRVPLFLFEADTIPGKVNRLFSPYAQRTMVHFASAGEQLKGSITLVDMPSMQVKEFTRKSVAEARKQLGLEPERFTLLVFGGSQGARAINDHIPQLLQLLTQRGFAVQLIHLTGDAAVARKMVSCCKELKLSHYIRDFDPGIGVHWRAASLAITRAGASTISEIIAFEVPAIVIPFPLAADGHQQKNGVFLTEEVRGGVAIAEKQVTAELLVEQVVNMAQTNSTFVEQICAYKEKHKKEHFATLIHQYLQKNK